MKTKEHELQMPLGPWEHDVKSMWTWFYFAKEEELYKREGLL
jgi:hypothetical protein